MTDSGRRTRNWLIAGVLAVVAIGFYASAFFGLSS